MPPLYRGIPKSRTKAYKDAQEGFVRPRGTSKDYEAHVRGESVATDVTSWTRDAAVARKFAGSDGIVLEIDETAVAGRIVDPHPLPNRYPQEQEVLVRGDVFGCRAV